LLECHLRLDEQGSVDSSSQVNQAKPLNRTVRKLLPIPGVNHAVIIDERGLPQDDDTDSAARMSAQGHYLVEMAQQLGELFDAQECSSLVVSGQAGHCMLFNSGDKALVVGVSANVDRINTENAIRKTLAHK